MSLAKILIAVDGSERDACALMTAVRAAKLFNAHVAALFAHPDPAEVLPLIGVPLSAEAMGAIVGGNIKIFRAAADKIRETIAQVCRAEGARAVSTPVRKDAVTISFREAIGHPPHVIGAAASLSDLAVMAPCAESPKAFETALDLTLAQRRPVLLAASPPRAFRKIMIGWNNTAPAAHGISAAIPFLQKAEIIEIVCLQPPGGPDFNADPVTAYLKAYGLACSEVHLRVLGSALHRSLGKFASEHRADLLVIGGFSHSRVRETFFGGVTNEFLREPPLPVLLAH
ncbi:MAG TPA: universal stress protein [Rhizomicrobium sp.]|nr:universal stress protein [Rhizomicrobium sp.]